MSDLTHLMYHLLSNCLGMLMKIQTIKKNSWLIQLNYFDKTVSGYTIGIILMVEVRTYL